MALLAQLILLVINMAISLFLMFFIVLLALSPALIIYWVWQKVGRR